MKKTILFFLVVSFTLAFTNELRAQRIIGAAGITLSGSINNNGTVLPPTTGGSYTYYLPSLGGTLLTNNSLDQYVWVLGGNTSPSSTDLGNNDIGGDLNLRAGNATRVSLDGSTGSVTVTGPSFGVNTILYSWPNSQASSIGQVLTNNGAGSLTWMSPTSTLVYGEVSPGIINANTNDYNIITTSGTYYRLSSSVDVEVTGITNGSAGRFIILANTGNNFIVLKDDDASSSVGNRFQMAGAGNDITISPEGTVGLIYDGADGVWRVVSMF